jgi:hypothetical protein
MAGFKNIRAYVDAAENGAYHITGFRKVPSQATTAGNWVDLSMASGNPVPNYYASSPLTAATLETEKGIWHGANVTPAQKHLRNFVIMTSSANAIPSTWYLCDYLMYYPFIDLDAVGEEQVMDNTVTLPRYTDGEGVRMFMVNVAPTVGGGQFTVNYTNSDGIAGRVTPVQFCSAATNIATFTATTQAAGGFKPFLQLQDGDKGVRSVESVTVSVANGGLGALVLAHPIRTITLRDINAPREVESIREVPDTPRVYDGAFLSLIGMTPTGSIASAVIAGYAEFIWS